MALGKMNLYGVGQSGKTKQELATDAEVASAAARKGDPARLPAE